MIKTCKKCGNSFNGRSHSQYCSRACYHGSRPTAKCFVCGKEFKTYPSLKSKYCSRDCYTESMKGVKRPHRTGQNNPNWKGGKHQTSQGYIKLYQPFHNRADSNGKVYAHVLSAECTLNRFLEPTEVIHHIDEDPTNNAPKNLYLFKTTGEHSTYHNALRRGDIEPICKSNLFHKN